MDKAGRTLLCLVILEASLDLTLWKNPYRLLIVSYSLCSAVIWKEEIIFYLRLMADLCPNRYNCLDVMVSEELDAKMIILWIQVS